MFLSNNYIKFMIKLTKLHIFIICMTILILISSLIISYKYVQQNSKLTLAQTFKNLNLISHNKQKISNLNLQGYPILLFFGFTHCPEVCPTTLGNLQNILENINKGDQVVKIVFVTLDPDRDNSINLKHYISGFGENVVGITGKIDQISKLAKRWNVYWEKIETGKNNYNINHTATVFMIDKNGDFSGTIAWGENQRSVKLKLQKLIHN